MQFSLQIPITGIFALDYHFNAKNTKLCPLELKAAPTHEERIDIH